MLVNTSFINHNDTIKTLEDILDHRDANPPAADQSAFETMMWQEIPWVMCRSTDGRHNCSGTIPKRDWLANRGGTCKDAVVKALEENPESLAVELDLCNLNSQMDSLCRKVLEKVQEVANANCLAMAGTLCLDKSYFYTPSTYSASNQQV
jgi:hypothetical protein